MKTLQKMGIFLLAAAMLFQIAACAANTAAPVFADVPADADYAQAVAWCAENGLMNGVDNDGNFDPDGPMTRAMLATMLYRQAGQPKLDGDPAFTDALPGVWYSAAVAWAAEKELLRGYGDGRFGVDDPVSKEMLTVVMARQNGKNPVWTGASELAVDAKRSEAAVALYETFHTQEDGKMYIQIGDTVWTATLEDNPSVTALKELLAKGPLTVDMDDYGGFEKVGSLGATLPQTNAQITTKPGDIILYQGNSITIYYDKNSWNFTLLGHIDGVADTELRNTLKAGGDNVSATFSLDAP